MNRDMNKDINRREEEYSNAIRYAFKANVIDKEVANL